MKALLALTTVALVLLAVSASANAAGTIGRYGPVPEGRWYGETKPNPIRYGLVPKPRYFGGAMPNPPRWNTNLQGLGALAAPNPRFWGIAGPNPRQWGLTKPNPRHWGIAGPNPRGFGMAVY